MPTSSFFLLAEAQLLKLFFFSPIIFFGVRILNIRVSTAAAYANLISFVLEGKQYNSYSFCLSVYYFF